MHVLKGCILYLAIDLLINLFFLYATIHDPNEKDNRNSLPLADRPSKKIVSHSEDEIKKQTEMAALMHRRRESIFGCENSRLPGSAEPTDMSETANVHKQGIVQVYQYIRELTSLQSHCEIISFLQRD